MLARKKTADRSAPGPEESMKILPFWLFFAAACWAGSAASQPAQASLPLNVPMPHSRPSEAPPRMETHRPRFPVLLPISEEEAEAAAKFCSAVLAKDKLIAEPARAAMWDNGCGAVGQITVSSIKLKDGKEVQLRPSALLRCETAEAVADWVRDELAPATESYSGISRIEVAASYHCRPRNNIRGARMSEHGRANALDVRAIAMRDGRRFGVDLPETPIKLLSDLRRGACAYFTTVLGPGSDGFHEDHFHVDLAKRRNDFRLCQWNLPSPPEPARHPQRVADPSTRQQPTP